MEWVKQNSKMFIPHRGNALWGCATAHPPEGPHHKPASQAILTQQGILSRRLHEVVGEDGGRPVRRLPRPQEKPSNTHLVGFHLSLPMEYVDNAPYF